jgi:hypothetical protein
MTMPLPVWMDGHLTKSDEKLRLGDLKEGKTLNIIGQYLLQ